MTDCLRRILEKSGGSVRVGSRVTRVLVGQGGAEGVVLATKPQMLDTAAPSVQALIGPRTLLISILAGKLCGVQKKDLPG